MRALQRLLSRFFLPRDPEERELKDELDGYVAMLVEEKIAQGMTPEEARRAARREFGSADSVKENVRDEWSGAWLDALAQHTRFGVRSLIRRPAFAASVILTLGIGIGATTSIFSLVDSVLFRPLPFNEPDRLVMVWEERRNFNLPRVEVSPPNYVEWAARSRSFASLAAYVNSSVNLTGEGNPERLVAAEVTSNFFSTLGVRPLIGRSFAEPDGATESEPVVVLSHSLWQRRFGGDPGVVGRSIRLNGRSRTVVGVMPSGFRFPQQSVDAWIATDYRAAAAEIRRLVFFLSVVGRLKDGVSIEQANAELRAIAGALASTYPENENSSAFAVAFQQDQSRTVRTSFLLLLSAAALVLLIACANVAGLLVTRGTNRDREFAIRRALGAGRKQLAGQLLLEGFLLSGAGAIVGLALAAPTFGILETLIPASLRGTLSPSLDVRLLAFAVGAALLTGPVFGLVPLRHAMGRRLQLSLRSRDAVAAIRGRRAQAALVVGEVGLAVMVLFSTLLMIRTIVNLEAVDTGFQSENVLTARIEPSPADYAEAPQLHSFHREVLGRVSRLPGVVSAGLTSRLPYTETIGAGPIRVDGWTGPQPEPGAAVAWFRTVTPGYLETLRVPLLAGRHFSARDTLDSPAVALVSERVGGVFGGDLLGRRIAIGDGPWVTIVGVVGDVRTEGVDTPPVRGTLYLPDTQIFGVGFMSPRDLVVRTSSDPSGLAETLRREVWAIDPNQTVSNIRDFESVVEAQFGQRKVQAGLFTAFAGLAVFMAALGIYGLFSFVVASRMRELGVRTALGAQRKSLVTLILGNCGVWIGAGLIAGLAMTVGVSRSMSALIYGVEPLDGLSLALSAGLLALVGIVASLVPVWRATRVDPMTVLRAD